MHHIDIVVEPAARHRALPALPGDVGQLPPPHEGHVPQNSVKPIMAAPAGSVGLQNFREVGANRLGKGGLEGPGVLAVLLSKDPVQAVAPHIVFTFFTRTIGLVEGGLGQLLDCDDRLHVLPKCFVVQLEIVGHCILLDEVPELSLGM